VYNGGCFTLIESVPFNPRSPKQCIDRLWEAGWEPTEKTKGHIKAERELQLERNKAKRKALEERLELYKVYGWRVSEQNLATLPVSAPEGYQKLVRWLMLAARLSTMDEWHAAYNADTGCIHGTFRHIGAWTGRMSHAAPNMANVPSGDSEFGEEMRSCWIAKPNETLLGVDADSIQLRIFAHYINDKKLIDAIVSGSQDDGTDPHSMNMRALGPKCVSRSVAKTFIYAFLLGAGIGKVGDILGCSFSEAKDSINQFMEFYPGLKVLREDKIPRDAARGYFEGFDGRLVKCNSAHHMLAGYLQNGEAVIMKKANLLWRSQLAQQNIPFVQSNFVHDEWQVRVLTRDLTTVNMCGTIISDSIRQTGLDLGLRCPLKGSIKIGSNWMDTH